MKRKGEKERAQSSATITQTLCLISGFSLILMVASYAVTTPGWWSGVLNGNPPNDYMVANQGQMKQFTARAVNELNIGLTNNGGAGSTLINLVYGWEQDYLTNGYATNTANPARPYKSSDYQAINVGQLKYIAGLVYGQLASAGYISMAPSWLHANPTSDYSAANLGQLKQAFNFDLSLPAVSSFTTTATMSGTVTLNWALASTTGVSSWLVEQESPTGGWSILTNITDPSVTSYSLSGLTNGQSAIYEVIAKGGNNVSASPSTPIYTQVPYQTNGIVDPGAPGTTNNEPVTPPVLYASGGGGQDSSNGSNGSGGITSAVNLANGAFVWSATDLKLPGVTPLAFTRTYVSSINYNGPLGVDWDFNYNRSLSVQSGAVYYHPIFPR
ncbi:MAG: fibronectin type III domain-containing protein [Methylacidiphilales bacterium]|nr:fibronectin type III domain-containing protein [Candidatus Methylacidiphilales bacterium]